MRLTLLSVATVAAIVIALSGLAGSEPALAALNRTAVLAVAAAALALLGRFIAEGPLIARVLLVIGGGKLLFEDLRVGRATTMVIALAIYGGAMLIVARKRR